MQYQYESEVNYKLTTEIFFFEGIYMYTQSGLIHTCFVE